MIFEISIKENKTVYMTKRHNSANAAIVLVEGKKLFKLWQNEPYHPEPQLAFGTIASWKNDYKYHSAERGFRQGKSNPVPVAKIVFGEADKHEPVYESKFKFFRKLVGYKTIRVPYVGFDDGISRTTWLMAYEAKIYPVECSVESAQLLHKLVAVSDSRIVWL